MPDLLLELFSEEIPARMQEQAIYDLRRDLYKRIGSTGLCTVDDWNEGRIDHAFVTPRRLAVWMTATYFLAQPDVSTELKGPKAMQPQGYRDLLPEKQPDT